MHLLRRDPGADPAPVLAAVGPLQFEVAVARLSTSSASRSASTRRTGRSPAARTSRGREDPARRAATPTSSTARDGTFMALFTSDFMLNRFEGLHPDVLLERMLTR